MLKKRKKIKDLKKRNPLNNNKIKKDRTKKKSKKNRTNLALPILTLILTIPFLLTILTQQSFAKEINSSAIFSSSEIILQYQKTNTINLQTKEKYLIDYITLYSYYYPQNLTSQKLIDFTSNFEKIKETKQKEKQQSILPYIFNITHPQATSINITQTFLLDNKIDYPKITTTASYLPIEDNYTKFSNLININKDIRKKANELASTSNDTFQIAVNIANWINKNIRYSLASIADNPKETSTWVFYHKVGVCKEITNLFVSMLRSLGIPSRVVVGQAYTNDPIFKKNWVGHAWAEVYINNKWIPFDLTYQEYGYIDPSHIIFQKLKNYSYEKSDSIITRGYGIKISKFSMNQSIKILKVYPEYKTNEKVTLTPDKTELKFGSVDYLTLKVTNLDNFYKYKKYYIVGPKEVILYNKNISLVLKPYQTKTIYINFKINNNLDKNYIYTLPIAVYDNNYDEITEIDLKSSQNSPYINKVIKEKNSSTINRITKYSSVSCFLKKYNRTNNKQLYHCIFTNKNPNMLKNIRICFNNKCFQDNFLILENKTYIFNTNKTNNTITFGNKKYLLYLNKTKIEKTKNLTNKKLQQEQNYSNYNNNFTKINHSNKKIQNFSNTQTKNLVDNKTTKKNSSIFRKSDLEKKNRSNNNLLKRIVNILKSIKEIIIFIFT